MNVNEEKKLVRGDVLAEGLQDLSVRSRNAVGRLGAETVGALAMLTAKELMLAANFGQASLVEIERFLETKGLALAESQTARRIPPPDLQDILRRIQRLETRVGL